MKGPEQDTCGHFLKSSANVYESIGSQSFKTTSRVLSESDVFEESRLVMMFLANFRFLDYYAVSD